MLTDDTAVCDLWGGQWPVNLRTARKSTDSTYIYTFSLIYAWTNGWANNRGRVSFDDNIDMTPKHIISCKILWFNTRWLCYSVWAKRPFFTILDLTPKLCYLFHFFFLIMIHTWLHLKMVPVFVNGRLFLEIFHILYNITLFTVVLISSVT